MSIQPLPDSVVSQIKSSTTITSLNSAVCGLFRNSLDSGATKVTISVEYIRGNCSVEDDGAGILPAEFKPGGGLGKLYFTSKYPVNEALHGTYGTFIASLGSLSLLSITSHHSSYHSHNSIQIHGSEVLARHIPSPPDQRLLSFPHGTRVTVRDLFGSMPVRVKQRAIEVERGIHFKHWELLKRDIVALILAWDRCVSVSVREVSNRWTFSVRNNQTNQNGEKFGVDLATTVCKILYQTQLSDNNKPEDWVPLKATAGGLSVTGVVSLHPVATKRTQFISIGIHPVSNGYGSTNILYEEINRIFSNSSFGVEEEPSNAASNECDGGEEYTHQSRDGFTAQELKGRKGIDRWPMFYIKIQTCGRTNPIPSKEMDEILNEQCHNLASIVDILKAVTYEFLKKYYFRPKRTRNAKADDASKKLKTDVPRTTPNLSSKSDIRSNSTTESRNKQLVGDLATTRLSVRRDHGSRSRPESPFDHWSRIKSGSPHQVTGNKVVDAQSTDGGCQAPTPFDVITPDLIKNNSESTSPLFGENGSLLRAPFSTANLQTPALDQSHRYVGVERQPSTEDIRWTNPLTKETLLIDPTTGFIIKSPKCCARDECETADLKQGERVRLCRRPASNVNRSAWLGELLSSWENPIFKTTEPQIPSALSEDNNPSRLVQPFRYGTWLQGPSEAGPPIQGRVSKAALRSAEIIAQVDRKFIFAKVLADPSTSKIREPQPTASLLLIIDQHAADERCRVESLMESYFESMDNETSTAYIARTEPLEQPLKFDISVREATQLEGTITHFAHWGIYYHAMPIYLTGTAGPRQIEVTKLPPSIAERCRLEPRLLIELLRQETWKIEAHSRHVNFEKDAGTQDGDATTPHWITRFHGCPQGILDMINSRACRSSIMFNDPLSRDECADLVKRLAECAFPFQCAHGRPSMAPLVDLGDETADACRKVASAETFGRAFRRWNVIGRTSK
ncbi:hypothetical protein F5Y14DRAFT_400980 [Nemania sp. NC0429]|nr:hypothetical protein F5Y14DRAFT_400980 [Nemania sp. NC0429]